MPYLDRTDAHYRFAAYRLDDVSLDAYNARKESEATLIREQIEREYGLRQQDLSTRMSIARMQAGSSRAATAAQAKAERAKIKLATRQLEELGIPELELKRWVAQKNDELAHLSFGLDVIKTAVQYQSTPDQYWMGKDFEAAIPGLLSGSRTSTAAPNEQPKPNTLEDLVARLNGGVRPSSAPPGTASAGGAADQATMTPQNAAQAVLDANPPSRYAGLSEGDQATLNSIKKIYEQGLDPYAVDALNPNQQALLVGGGKRLGRSVETDLWRMNQKRVGQGDPRAA